MTVAERIHNDAMNHLSKARQAMKKLAACTADWSAGVPIEIEFENLESDCMEFGLCQFGLTAPKHEKTVKTPGMGIL